MPIFYLGLTVLAVAGWVVGRYAGTEKPIEPVETDQVRLKRVENPSKLQASPPTDAPSPNDPILRTPEGLLRKVVVTDLGVRPRGSLAGEMFVGGPLDYFGLFFVLRDPPAGSERIRIGLRDGSPVGWVPKSSVLEWDSRLVAVPTADPARPRLRLFEEPNCLLDDLADRDCPKHGRNCPVSGEEPAWTETSSSADLGWPVLDSRSAPQLDGTNHTILKVASLVRDNTPLVEPTEPPAELVPLLKEIDLAFVIDTTASMQNAIDTVKTLANELVDSTRQRFSGMRLKLALVEYRDRSTAYPFETRRTIDFCDPQTFEKALGQVSAAKKGDGSVEEAVLAGVRAALPHEPGDDPTRPALSWPEGRAGELATKVVVLLGDSPDHDPDPRTAIDLAERAKRQKVTIASVSISKPGVLKGSEVDRYRALWHSMAERSYRPADPAQGFSEAIPPLEWSISGRVDEGVEHLQSLVDDRVAHARALAALAQAEAEGRLKEYTNSRGLRMDQVAPVLAGLHRGEPRTGPRDNRRLEGTEAPSVRVGWIAQKQSGQPLVSLAVLMSRAELDAFIGQLIRIQQDLETHSEGLADLLRAETDALAGESSDQTGRSGASLGTELSRRAGLPTPPPGSLLGRSAEELRQADNLFRASLSRRLRDAIEDLLKNRSDPSRAKPSGFGRGMQLIPYENFLI